MFYLGHRHRAPANSDMATSRPAGRCTRGGAVGSTGRVVYRVLTQPSVFEAYSRNIKIYSSQTAVSTVISRFIYNMMDLAMD